MEANAKPNLCVRDACEQDLDALERIKPPRALHVDRLADAQKEGFSYLLLERDGKAIGHACLVWQVPESWSDPEKHTRLPMVIDLLVAEEERGKGYGSFFVEQLARLAAQRRSERLSLSVDPIENPRARDFYLRLGFVQEQETPYASQWEFWDSEGNRHAGKDWLVDMYLPLTE